MVMHSPFHDPIRDVMRPAMLSDRNTPPTPPGPTPTILIPFIAGVSPDIGFGETQGYIDGDIGSLGPVQGVDGSDVSLITTDSNQNFAISLNQDFSNVLESTVTVYIQGRDDSLNEILTTPVTFVAGSTAFNLSGVTFNFADGNAYSVSIFDKVVI